MSEHNPWTTLSSRLVYQNAWMRIREDQVIRPDGHPGIYGVLEAAAATGVVAVTDADEIVLVGQYRYPTDVYSWEIVEGAARGDESPLEGAIRELREEAGLEADQWTALGGEIHLSNCMTAERGYLFLARGLREVGASPDATEILQVRHIPFVQCMEMVDSGAITDSMSLIGLLRYARGLRFGG